MNESPVNESADASAAEDTVDAQVDRWRGHLASAGADPAELEEREARLRERIDALRASGLTDDEAFLVAVKRMGAADAFTREFVLAHSDRLWRQIVLSEFDPWGSGAWSEADSSGGSGWPAGLTVALALAVAAGVSTKVPELFGIRLADDSGEIFYPLNMSFFALPFVAAWFAWNRALSRKLLAGLAAVFLAAAVTVNAYPFPDAGVIDTAILTSLHLPLALWLAVGVAYVGGRWRGNPARMDFVRFTGELFIYFVLIALGGGVLTASTVGLFAAIGIDLEPIIAGWIILPGAAGAAVVASWLVEARKRVVEDMAPMLTRVFTPLFALSLITFVATMLGTGRGVDVEREVLIAFDLLLVVVFGLLLYSLSARDPDDPPGLFDWIQVVLVGTALVVDMLALWAIGARITEFGFTPNRVAALGENVVLLVNLTGSLALYAGFLRGRTRFERLVDWHTTYLYVFAAWAAVVAFLFPLVFGFR